MGKRSDRGYSRGEMNKRLGIIVDGQGDFASLNSRFKDRFRILKTDGPRGHTVTPEQIITGSRKQVAMLQALRCTQVMLIIDFEERPISYYDFLKNLRAQLKSVDFGISIVVVMPNKMIENWYLADIEHLSKKKAFLKDHLKQKNYEGRHGKNELKKLFKTGISYDETKHGPQMFCTIRFQMAKRNSRSFKDFCDVIEQIELCGRRTSLV